jgi:ribokinase
MMPDEGETSLGRVLVAGAINTDLVGSVERTPAAGETVTGRSFDIFGGGKGANQAVAARRSGAAVSLVGAVGDDDFGTQREAELLAEGIDIRSVVRRDNASSGVALILVDEGGENRIAYIPGATLTITEDDVVEAVSRTSPEVYLQPNEVPRESALAGLRRAGELGALRLLNAAPDPKDVLPLLAHVDILIVNAGEAGELAGSGDGDNELPTVAKRLAERHGIDVVVTAGAMGAIASYRGEFIRVPAPDVIAVDTTGAGDAFCGAFAARLASGAGFEVAMQWAVTAASLAVTVAGAQPSIPDASAIREKSRSRPST